MNIEADILACEDRHFQDGAVQGLLSVADVMVANEAAFGGVFREDGIEEEECCAVEVMAIGKHLLQVIVNRLVVFEALGRLAEITEA